jgi:hypothetical protein
MTVMVSPVSTSAVEKKRQVSQRCRDSEMGVGENKDTTRQGKTKQNKTAQVRQNKDKDKDNNKDKDKEKVNTTQHNTTQYKTIQRR